MIYSDAFTANASCKLDVLRHDGDTLGVDCTQVCVLKETDHVGLCCFLKSKHSLRLEPEIRLVLSCNFTDEALERQLPD